MIKRSDKAARLLAFSFPFEITAKKDRLNWGQKLLYAANFFLIQFSADYVRCIPICHSNVYIYILCLREKKYFFHRHVFYVYFINFGENESLRVKRKEAKKNEYQQQPLSKQMESEKRCKKAMNEMKLTESEQIYISCTRTSEHSGPNLISFRVQIKKHAPFLSFRFVVLFGFIGF